MSVHWPVSSLALAGPLTSTHPTAQGGEHSIVIQTRGLSLCALYWSETGDVVLVLMDYVKSRNTLLCPFFTQLWLLLYKIFMLEEFVKDPNQTGFVGVRLQLGARPG